MKRSVLILSYSDLRRDMRIGRQLAYFLENGYRVTVTGSHAPSFDGIEFFDIYSQTRPLIDINKLKRFLAWGLRQYDAAYFLNPRVQKCLKILGGSSFDLIVANDLDTLPLAVALRQKSKILFDAHEYAPREVEDDPIWVLKYRAYRNYLCSKYIPQVSAMTTVGYSIAQEYEKNFGGECQVISNAPRRFALTPRLTSDDSIKLIYHGAAFPNRKIEEAIDIFDLLDSRFSLDMYLVSELYTPYLKHLHDRIKKSPRVRIMPPVPSKEVIPLCNQYDIGFFPLASQDNFNYHHCLPNKFFEFIQARLAVAIFPLPEMMRIVTQFGCGVVAADFTNAAFAKMLNGLDSAQIMAMKQRSHAAAEVLCSEVNSHKFDQIVQSLLTTHKAQSSS